MESSAQYVDSGRAWYASPIASFLDTEPNTIVGTLTRNSSFSVDPTQTAAWLAEISILKTTLKGLAGSLFLEFNIPRMGRRVDAVVVLGPAVIAIEFKVGDDTHDLAAIEQVWDYSLDLKYFHRGSHHVPVLPILVATSATHSPRAAFSADADGLFRPLAMTVETLRPAIISFLNSLPPDVLDGRLWAREPYHPTPTIIEAARALYARHSVEDIARHDAGENLTITSQHVESILRDARSRQRKAICFVTGVPGAGKTLVGLNIATQHRAKDEPAHAVFLSGNGPLVDVLQEALVRDEVARNRAQGITIRKVDAGKGIKAFIQNVHHFRDNCLIDSDPPFEHVAIFDEAQRAWNLRKTVDFMKRKKGRPDFSQSEPDFLLSCMNRHADWAVVICLVGGGQEINDGEAGIGAWLESVTTLFKDWDVHISPHLSDTEYAAGETLTSLRGRPNVHFADALHLAVSMRSFRAEHVSRFVKALLDCDTAGARELRDAFSDRFPLLVTRDLGRAKAWVRERARGSERYGLLASSSAQRLKPHAIDVRVKTDHRLWHLNGKDDTRSSYYLEDAATEFQIQGLEIDWACVTWDGDLRRTDSGWSFHDFKGSKWTRVKLEQNRTYLKNAYRVLLTRARQGMIIFVPPGASDDPTRAASHYDPTFDYLRQIGIPEL
jgi:hypothetical protein